MSAKRTAEEWGRVAVSLPGWRWMRGMQSMQSRRISWIAETGYAGGILLDDARVRPGNGAVAHDDVPDPDDPATAGCLLALLGPLDEADEIADALYLHRRDCPAEMVLDPLQEHGITRTGRACIAAAEALGRWPGGGR